MSIKFSIFTIVVFMSFNAIGQTLIPYYDNGKYGYSDINGSIKIQPKYESVDFFKKDSITIVKKDGKKVIINKKGFEFSSYPDDEELRILPVTQINHQKKVRRLKPIMVDNIPIAIDVATYTDTLKHLRWVMMGRDEYQLLNLNSQSTSAVYQRNSSKNSLYSIHFLSEPLGFKHGYHIGSISDNNYEILNTEGIRINKSQNNPTIWSPQSITLKSNDRESLYKPRSNHTHEYPYKSILKVIEDKILIISNSEQKKGFYRFNRENDKYGIINIDGQVILDTVYQSIYYQNGKYILQKDGKVLLTDLENNLVDSTLYKSITPLNDSLFLAKRHDDKVKVLNLSGEPFLNDQSFDEFKFLRNELYYTARKGDTVSILDSMLNIEISYVAESIYRDYERNDRYIVYLNGLHGMIDSKKQIILPIKYDRCYNNRENLIMLSKDDKKGVADSTGKIILEPVYEEVRIEVLQNDTLIRPKKDGFYACYNLRGEQLAGFTSRSSYLSGESINRDRNDGLYHFTDYYGSPLNITSKNYYYGHTIEDSIFMAVLYNRDTINDVFIRDKTFETWGKDFDSIVNVNINKGLIAVSKDNRQAVIDIRGNIISPFEEQNILEINNEFFISKKEDKYYLFDNDGKPINEQGYDHISDSVINGRRSVYNIIPDKFYKYAPHPCFSENQDTILKPQRNFGYIDKFGEVLIPLEYGSTFRYFEDYVYLSKGYIDGQKQSFLIDTSGKIVLETQSDKLYPLDHSDKSGYYIAEVKGKHGLIDLEGNTVIPFEYSAIQGFFGEKIINARDFNNEWHLLSIDNKILCSGNHGNGRTYDRCHSVAKDKVLFFPENKPEIIDLDGNTVMKIDSYDIGFVTIDEIDMIIVNMGDYEYYINRETLVEYKN